LPSAQPLILHRKINMTIYTSEQVRPYVYMGTHKITGQFYIGYREVNKIPSHLDIHKYQTSSEEIAELGFDNFDWVIVAEFFGHCAGYDAYDFENDLIKENFDNPLNLNGQYWDWGSGYQRFRGRTKHTEEHKMKLSQKNKILVENGTHPFLGGENQRRLVSEGIHQFVVEKTCPHCGFTGKGTNMERYHFDNCSHNEKFKEISIPICEITCMEWGWEWEPVYNIAQFCRDEPRLGGKNSRNHIGELIKGIIPQFNGFVCRKPDMIYEEFFTYHSWEVNCRDWGEKWVEVRNMTEFCKNSGDLKLSISGMSQTATGLYEWHKNYRCRKIIKKVRIPR